MIKINKFLITAIFTFLFSILLLTYTTFCFAQDPSNPLPPLQNVLPEKLIKPEDGIGSISYGDSIDKVELAFGKGEIIPEEPDFQGNNIINLIYKEQGIVFKFFNGKMAMVIIDKPGFATKTGVQVGGDVGDLIREFGSKYNMSKSITPEVESDQPDYEIMYKNIAASVKGKMILKLRIMTTKKL